jgi:cysteine desulfurase/selenocysteine lyase
VSAAATGPSAQVPGVQIRDLGEDLSGLVTFTLDTVTADLVRSRLLDAGVTVSVSGSASTLLDMQARGLESVVRASPHYFVSPDQIARAVRSVAEVAG